MKRVSILTMTFLIVCLAFGKVVLTARLATEGIEIARIESEVEKISVENQRLEEKIASFTSLSQLSQAAAKLGFEEKVRVVSLTSEVSVALRR